MFAYTTFDIDRKDRNWSRYERAEPHNPLLDFVVASVYLSSSLHPSKPYPLETLHSRAAKWYKQATEIYKFTSIRSSYTWHNNSWEPKLSL